MMSRNSEKLNCSNKINSVQSGSSALTFALNKKKKKRKKRATTATTILKQAKQKDKLTSHRIIQNKFVSSSNLSLAQSASSFYDVDEEIVNDGNLNDGARFYCYSCPFCKSIDCQCAKEKSETFESAVNINSTKVHDIATTTDQWNIIGNNNIESLESTIDVCELRKKKQQSSNNNNTGQFNRFAIYENLCKHCGFAIGNANGHLHCVEDKTTQNSVGIAYENYCVSCHSVFSGPGDNCIKCSHKKPPSFAENQVPSKKPATSNRQITKLSEIFGNLKSKLKEKSPKANGLHTVHTSTTIAKPKIEIIHNCDDVFKTNTTFDLNEIVQLKYKASASQAASPTATNKKNKEKNIYGKLRSTNETISNNHLPSATKSESRMKQKLPAASSESSFFRNYSFSLRNLSNSSSTIASDTVWYDSLTAPPSYEDAVENRNGIYTSVNLLKETKAPKFNCSSSLSSSSTPSASSLSSLLLSVVPSSVQSTVYASDSLASWMTSLKWQTHDYSYDDDRFMGCSVKCIPSKLFICCENLNHSKCVFKQKNIPIAKMNSGDDDDVNVRRVNKFKQNLLEAVELNKRNAIYFGQNESDVPLPLEIAGSKSVCASKYESESPAIETVSHEIRPKNEVVLIESGIPLHRHNDDEYGGTHRYMEVAATKHNNNEHEQHIAIISNRMTTLKTFYFTQITLSTSLNRLLLVYDKEFHNFLSMLSVRLQQWEQRQQLNNQHIVKYSRPLVNSLNDIFIMFNEINASKPLVTVKKGKTMNSSATNVEHRKVSKQIKLCEKRKLSDFVRPQSIEQNWSGKQTIGDFEKFTTETVLKSDSKINASVNPKKFEDFHKPVCNEIRVQKKTIHDFVVKTPTAKPITKESNDYSLTEMSSQRCSQTHSHLEQPSKKQQNAEMIDLHENVNDENIYQPIWMFKTIGNGIETCDRNNEYDDDDEDFYTNADYENIQNTEIVDANEWDAAEEEFLFSTDRTIDLTEFQNSVSHLTDAKQITSETFNRADGANLSNKNVQINVNNENLYQRICILYRVNDSKYNKIIHDYNENGVYNNDTQLKIPTTSTQTATSDCFDGNQSVSNIKNSKNVNLNKQFIKNEQKLMIKNANLTQNQRFDSVDAWKRMLRTMEFLEDEEDLILPETFLLENLQKQNNSTNNLNTSAENDSLFGSSTLLVIDDDNYSDTTKSSIRTERTDETDVSSNNSLNSTISQSTGTVTNATTTATTVQSSSEIKVKRELGFLNKLQYRRFDITKNVKKDDSVQGLFYKNLNGKYSNEPSPLMEIKKLHNSSNLVFGGDLEEIEKDDKFPDIPKFVIECIKIIELEENIQTNGIYRESGKKDSIDKLKKRMNESKLRKGTKYVALKDEEIHTVTGALKQFLRELKTSLIPIEIVNNLPNDLETEENLVKIKNEMDTIDYLPRELLKYILKHLILVDKNSEHNLMNASNLSIIWGACIFTSSVNATDIFDTSDLNKKNTLFKILIQRYDDIFTEIDRLI